MQRRDSFFYGFFVFARATLWLLNPQDSLFVAGLIHQLYFLVITVFEVGVGITWVMMNNQRLEAELMASRDNLRVTVSKLEEAMSEVNTLSGIIPICMHCKEIRDDQGYWNRIEKFISDHSEAEFSHGICPKCIKENILINAMTRIIDDKAFERICRFLQPALPQPAVLLGDA